MSVRMQVTAAVGAALMLAAMAVAALGQSDEPVPTDRLDGPTRFETAVAISQRAFPSGAQVAYLARADVLADAVAGGTLTDGPVLLVPACGDLPTAVRNELTRLDPGVITALGGTAAVCDAVLAAAADTGYAVEVGAGLVEFEAEGSVADTVSRITGAIDAGPANVVAVVDHAQAAADAGLDLPPTTLVIFGNPQVGTPLMQTSQTTAIDLPQKLLVYEDADGTVRVAYNDPSYLDARHALTVQSERLDTIRGLLANLATAGAVVAAAPDPGGVSEGVGLLRMSSGDSVADTVDRITAAIDDSPASVVQTVDHAQAAADAGLTLRPTTLIIFGNPAAGTPLMQASRTAAIDLPQKLLVYEDAAGVVFVAWNDPGYLAARHGIDGADEQLDAIAGLLQSLATGS